MENVGEDQLSGPLDSMIEKSEERSTAARESDLRFSQISDNIEEVFWLGDARDPEQFRILYVSPAFEQLWQISAEELYDGCVYFFRKGT